jgi:hypothetical protein
MRCTLLLTILSVFALGCADANPSLEGLEDSPVLALEGPWIDDPVTPPASTDAGAKPGLDEPSDQDTGPWLDPPLPPSGSPASAPQGYPRYDFEFGAEGWTRSGSPIAQVTLSGAQRVSGRQSLAIDVDGAGTAQVNVPNPPLRPGATVTFHIFIPAGAQLSWVQPFVQQDQSANWQWTGNWQPLSALRQNAWNTLTVSAPRNARRFMTLGVQLSTASGWRGRIYVDAVSF